MPEYLAPGVYVEETSFRARSIEGVSTSTTGFVGSSRKGPSSGPVELVTSYRAFERIFGGFTDLDFAGSRSVNHLAHSVQAYFENGGRRLYVARVWTQGGSDGIAVQQGWLVGDGDDAAASARFVARFPGSGGNGAVEVREQATAATRRTLDSAPVGSLARFGGAAPSQPARLEGAVLPLSLGDGDRLRFNIGGGNTQITVRGAAARVVAGSDLAEPVPIAADDNALEVVLGGLAQTVTLPTGDVPRADLVAALNRDLRHGFAELEGDRLALGTDARGTSASLTITGAPAVLGLVAGVTQNAADANNNVGDLAAVSAAEIDALLGDGIGAVDSGGRLGLETTATGAAASLTILANTAAGFGLAADDTDSGEDGAVVTVYVKTADGWRNSEDGAPAGFDALAPTAAPAGGADLLTLVVVSRDADGVLRLHEDLGFDRRHPRFVATVLAQEPDRGIDRLENQVAAQVGGSVTAFALRAGLFPSSNAREIPLAGGNDGAEPNQAAFAQALSRLEAIDDIAIVAAPGSSARTDRDGIRGALISHAERRRAYRIAVLDAPADLTVGEARADRGKYDSTHAAYYHPWVVISNPLARPGDASVPREIQVPPSGIVCGVYARTDIDRGVHKAPANETVRGSLRLAIDLSTAEQEVLNPEGVNLLRSFPGRGTRVWGARTASSDPEWKYVNVRRYFLYLERSIDEGTQWAVFEPNGPRLWANVRETLSGFLYNEWRNGALLGANPKEAFFVRCDRSTMTQNDLDTGRLICEIGVAALKPAEFVIFRIGQKTADSRD